MQHAVRIPADCTQHGPLPPQLASCACFPRPSSLTGHLAALQPQRARAAGGAPLNCAQRKLSRPKSRSLILPVFIATLVEFWGSPIRRDFADRVEKATRVWSPDRAKQMPRSRRREQGTPVDSRRCSVRAYHLHPRLSEVTHALVRCSFLDRWVIQARQRAKAAPHAPARC